MKKSIRLGIMIPNTLGGETFIEFGRVSLPVVTEDDFGAKHCCGNERPPRKVLCQLKKGHKGSHRAVIYWE